MTKKFKYYWSIYLNTPEQVEALRVLRDEGNINVQKIFRDAIREAIQKYKEEYPIVKDF